MVLVVENSFPFWKNFFTLEKFNVEKILNLKICSKSNESTSSFQGDENGPWFLFWMHIICSMKRYLYRVKNRFSIQIYSFKSKYSENLNINWIDIINPSCWAKWPWAFDAWLSLIWRANSPLRNIHNSFLDICLN